MKISKRAMKKYSVRKSQQKALRVAFLKTQNMTFDLEANRLDEPWLTRAYEETTCEPKGMPGGRCNVTSCQADGAVFLNVGMIRAHHPDTGGCYYCAECARDIHEHNHPDDGFTLFPAFDEVMARYRELWHGKVSDDGSRRGIRSHIDAMFDMSNYADIDQNPWGGSSHRLRDEYLERLNELDTED